MKYQEFDVAGRCNRRVVIANHGENSWSGGRNHNFEGAVVRRWEEKLERVKICNPTIKLIFKKGRSEDMGCIMLYTLGTWQCV
jgi:hypothetical protein